MVIGAKDKKDTPYNPTIDPANFVSKIDNPFMPLAPKTMFIYEGKSKFGVQRDVDYVMEKTINILGVTCMVVHNTAYYNGKLAEETYDWFAQDKDGNIWYFGEDSKEYRNGKVISTKDSWKSGVNGALPGITIKGIQKVGDSYRQEYAKGTSEDMAEVLSLNESIKVKYGSFKNVLMTKEWSPLEPDVIEHKYYVSGIGFVFSKYIQGGSGAPDMELIEIKKGCK